MGENTTSICPFVLIRGSFLDFPITLTSSGGADGPFLHRAHSNTKPFAPLPWLRFSWLALALLTVAVTIFAGEPFPTKYLRDLKRRLPHARFGNIYGPTEVNGVS